MASLRPRVEFGSLPDSQSVEVAAAGLVARFADMTNPHVVPDVLKAATTWLGALQASTEAWPVLTYALAELAPPPPPAALLFCAQMLANKVQYAYHELGAVEARSSLRTKVMELLGRYAEAEWEDVETRNKLVERLCIALANVAVQMIEWTTPIADVVAGFGESPALSFVLLRFLAVFPEQVKDGRNPVIFNRKIQLANYLEAASEDVLNLLHQFLNMASEPDAQMALLVAFRSWLTAGELPRDRLLTSPLVELAFEATNRPELFEAALATLAELVKYTTETGTEPGNEVALAVLDNSLALSPALAGVLNGDIEPGPLAEAIIRFFIDVGESYVVLAARGHEPALAAVEMVLAINCASTTSLQHVEATIMFWYLLAEEVNQLQSAKHTAAFAKTFQSLLASLVERAAYGPNADNESDEALFDFITFRTRLGSQMLRDICLVLSGHGVLAELCSILHGLPEVYHDEAGRLVGWQPIEALLFGINALASEVSAEENELLPGLLEWLTSLPLHERLSTSILIVFSSYARWLKYHPEQLGTIVEYTVELVSQPMVQEVAATTLKCICDDSAVYLGANFEQLGQMFLDALDGECSHLTRAELLRACGFVISEMEVEKAVAAMAQMYEPISERIVALCESLSAGSGSDQSVSQLQELLALVHSLVQACYVPDENYVHIVQTLGIAFMRGTWGLMSAVLELCSEVETVCETICGGVLKYAIKATGVEFLEFLEPILEAMLEGYRAQPFSCYLYVVYMLMARFCAASELEELITSKLSAFSVITFERLQQENGFVMHPEVVMEYFEIVVAILRRVPRLVVADSELLRTLLDCGLVGLKVDHVPACRAVLAFVDHIVVCALGTNKGEKLSGELHELVLRTLDEYGPSISSALVLTVVHKLADLETEIAAVLLSFLQLDVVKFCTWMYDVLDLIPDSLVTPQNKHELMEHLAKSQSRAEVSVIMKELAVLYRMRAEAPGAR
ncbi:uncharacterized protein AMSG_05787 [Thecamonas trahens ATCC 50062]|uniref:Exportin-1/Importin-beta-like domain-containing protein n=1 Tax=Thecamonas trahens ATCC 50062 TaxID=461836 RepID=A0A0L0DCG4_THETB|nr:hypothetical protein AMSG_05787 [Thecamonas trahens ATCC 50062]KNC50029.1 hypothetical protein AMSG_05787 [Thecamonas trahens ATCC 50062]|eukprot:XP_013757196.1 hypothetical protein AMSG_05787 [Thecamonas trahens ATCC 50062]